MTTTEGLTALPLPPGRYGLPVLGETLSFFGDRHFAQKRHEQYGAVFKTRLLGKPTIFMRGAEANRFVLTNENQYFVVTWPPSTKALLGPLSLALQTGGTHQSRRKLLAQAFLPRALSGYIAAMEDITQRYLQSWEKQRSLTWYPELRNYTFDVACKLLVGFDAGSQTRLGHLFEVWCEGLFSLPLNFPWTRFGRALKARDLMLKELESIICDRQQSPDPSNDALGLLMQARDEVGDRLTLEELKDQILLLLFAGHETLTSAIASFCLLMAQHPQIFERVRQEQQQFPWDAPLTLEQLKQMSYLEQVLKEVLRLIPPVGGGFREVLQTCEYNGFCIPSGWNVLYQIGPTHKDEAAYPDPDRFDPDRFNPERTASLEEQKYGYVPFGGGIRECLGKEFARLEMKLFAVHLAQQYEWKLLPQDLEMVTIPTPRPRDGLKVEFLRHFKH
jgi:cytochrome P450